MKEDFIETLKCTGKEQLGVWVMNRLSEIDPEGDRIVAEEDALKELISDMRPANLKQITNIRYIISLYLDYLGRTDVNEVLNHISRQDIWALCIKKGTLERKFISKDALEELMSDIESYEEFNSEYYAALIRAIFEGIYSDDLSVIINLRRSDINVRKKMVTLRPDKAEPFDLTISDQLVDELLKMSEYTEWTRKNRYSTFEIALEGIYPDSCFRIENRNDGGNYRYSYFHYIRKITRNYLGQNLSPKNIYLSGVVYQVIEELKKHDLTLDYALEHPRFSWPYITSVLERMHYPREWRYIKQCIYGRIGELTGEE